VVAAYTLPKPGAKLRQGIRSIGAKPALGIKGDDRVASHALAQVRRTVRAEWALNGTHSARPHSTAMGLQRRLKETSAEGTVTRGRGLSFQLSPTNGSRPIQSVADRGPES